mmetsp:Transcript_15523/g.28200  ORF Transcript_15523/g.28200 Transcript_15523/m.28200 type:complete len:433 (+) Transcript_15523:257-1555(+)
MRPRTCTTEPNYHHITQNAGVVGVDLPSSSKNHEEKRCPQQRRVVLYIIIACILVATIVRIKPNKNSEAVMASSSSRKQNLDSDQKHEHETNETLDSTKSVSTAYLNGLDNSTEDHSHTMFLCGRHIVDYPNLFLQSVFPEYTRQVDLRTEIQPYNSTQNDLVVFGKYGKCPVAHWIDHEFKGKIVYIDTEAQIFDRKDRDMRNFNSYEIGPRADSIRSVRVYFCTLSIAVRDSRTELEASIFNPSWRRQTNVREHFLIYAQGHSVSHREWAFHNLSQIETAHYAGVCRGIDALTTNVLEAPNNTRDNYILYHRYRFCLVMENQKQNGYITEKIVNAFTGGCIPIYYGTREVFNLFNKESFIYYDVDHPQPALNRVAYLESNETAYNEVLGQPIFANGQDTIEQYFSYRDDLGGGMLKRRIRDMLELPQIVS